MKSPGEMMEILEAYDLTGSLRGAAALAECDHKTVARSPVRVVVSSARPCEMGAREGRGVDSPPRGETAPSLRDHGGR